MVFLSKKDNTGPYFIKIRFEEWKLFLSIIDMKDKEKYERKYLLSSIRRIVRDYQIVCRKLY